MAWLFRWEKFYKVCKIAPIKQALIAFYTLQAKHNHGTIILRRNPSSWTELKHQICLHFGPNVYMDFCGELTRLQQWCSVSDESCINWWIELECQLINKYTNGRKDGSKNELKARIPITLKEAIGLAYMLDPNNSWWNLSW